MGKCGSDLRGGPGDLLILASIALRGKSLPQLAPRQPLTVAEAVRALWNTIGAHHRSQVIREKRHAMRLLG
ncbi:hypothetical protein PSP6_1130005 [Paraburkholderia tropica]|nr:hypothetical protein PSP6_1130005 [Paraburkholderia tropica]